MTPRPTSGRRLSEAPRLAPLSDRRKGPARAEGLRTGTSLYRGAAIRTADPGRRRRRRRLAALLIAGAGAAFLVAAMVSSFGRPLRDRLAAWAEAAHVGQAQVVTHGNEFLSEADVRKAAGLEERVSYFGADLDAARTALGEHPRVRAAAVARRWDGKIVLRVEERKPVALLPHRRPVEVDAEGRILPALAEGALADRPIVRGLDAPRKGLLEDPDWVRALAWMQALAAPEIQLLSRLSEIDVGEDGVTRLVLSPHGTQVLLPAMTTDRTRLAALRVVLADLKGKNLEAETIDCRAARMVVVRPFASSRPRGTEKADASRPRRFRLS